MQNHNVGDWKACVHVCVAALYVNIGQKKKNKLQPSLGENLYAHTHSYMQHIRLLMINTVLHPFDSHVGKTREGCLTVDGGQIATVQKHADEKLACQCASMNLMRWEMTNAGKK